MSEEEKKTVIAYKQCFASEQGQKVLDDLSFYCFEKRSTFVEGSQEKQNVNNGKRSVLLHIRDFIEKDLDKPEVEQKPKEPDYI